MKRTFDAAAAAIGLVVCLPIILVVMIAIRVETPGPAIFAQVRVGRREQHFVCYKLRTMHKDTKNVPTHETSAAAVTRVGAFIRKLKIDELPQLWNVLLGEMSLVGPRPCLPSQTALIEARNKRGVLEIPPGVTGLAQVNGIDMSAPEVLASMDAEYLRIRSFTVDLRLILATILGRGIGIDHVSGRQ